MKRFDGIEVLLSYGDFVFLLQSFIEVNYFFRYMVFLVIPTKSHTTNVSATVLAFRL